MPYALVIQKWLIKFWKFYIHNICRSLIQLVQKKYIEMEYRFSLNSYWCYVPCAAYRQTRSTRPFHFHSFFVEAFLFQFLLCVKRAVSTVQFAGFLGFLFRYPTFNVILSAGSVLPPSL